MAIEVTALFPMWRADTEFIMSLTRWLCFRCGVPPQLQIYLFKMDNQYVQGADALQRKLNLAKQYLQDDVKDVIGTEAVKQFKKNFEQEGFVDKNVSKWAGRKTKRSGSTNSQKVLSKSGELAESIDYRKEGEGVVVYTDKPYAEIHNEGGEITVTPQMKKYFWAMHRQAKDGGDLDMADQYKGMALAKKITMPKRQFIGESEVLTENITNKIVRDLTKILNG